MDSIFIECFGNITDPRVERTKKHLLLDILAISICGVLSGAENWQEIEDFGNAHKDWFIQFLSLPYGIPSHDTISRVFSVLEPQSFQSSCINWLKRIKSLFPGTIIPIDGKTLRGSKRKQTCEKALHIINAWSCANSVCLGQLKIDDKSNEIPAVSELLKALYIKGAIVTLDAIGAQEKTVKLITDMDADYVIALKGNQGDLYETVQDTFTLNEKSIDPLKIYSATDKKDVSHGRIDLRKIDVIGTSKLKEQIDSRWKALNSLAKITYSRTENGETQVEERYYISSLSPKDPARILNTIRAHWQVENCLHWSLDVAFREDNSRIRDANAASNFSWLRKFALGLLKNENSFKASIRRKQRKAHTCLNYLAKLLGQI